MLDKFLPPTDNLYKFLAISGLLLIVVSFVPSYFNFRLWEQKYDYLKNLTIFAAEAKKFAQDYENLNSNLRELNQKYGDTNKSYEELFALSDNVENEVKKKNYQKASELIKSYKSNSQLIQEKNKEINKLKENIEKEKGEINNKQIQIDTKNAEIDKTKNIIEYYDGEIFRLKIASVFIFVLGIFTAICGFYLWYTKIQKINDQLLINEGQQNKRYKPRRVKPL